MVAEPPVGHDGGMNAEDTRATPPDGDFEAYKLRTITDMKRSTDDRLVAGVCAGAAKYLNIDPVIVRVVIAVLTFVGFAGPIIYLAAWFLLPAEGEDKSVAADWFRLDKNEEQVRVAGLVGAIVLAAVAVVGDSGWGWGGAPWVLLPLAAVFYLFVVRPRRRREAETRLAAQHPPQYAPPGADPADESTRGPEFSAAKSALVSRQKAEKAGRERSWKLTWLTASVTALALAATLIYAEYHDKQPWTTYVAVALTVVAVGLLVSTFFGHGGPLIGIGVLLAVALAVGSVVPSPRLGQDIFVPQTSAELKSSYKHGIGELRIDLTQVRDPADLVGRTIDIDAGVGKVEIHVPDGVVVDVEASLWLGEIKIFDRKTNGTDNRLDYDGGVAALTFDIHQRIGQIEVIRS